MISALTGEGCKELTYAIMEHLEQNRPPLDDTEEQAETSTETPDTGQRTPAATE